MDVPSGMDGNAALNSEVCVCADRTITFECLKKGMLSFEQRKKCGKIDVVSIGILPQYRQCSDPTLVLTKDHAVSYTHLESDRRAACIAASSAHLS